MALFKNPSNNAQQYVSQIPGAVQPYLNPYINAGNQALGALNNQYSNLLGNYGELSNQYSAMAKNPAAVMNSIGSTYQSSPGYQFQLGQAEQSEANRADAGGYAGTPQDQQYSSQIASQMANQNYYDYLNHASKFYDQGLRGLQDFYNRGLQGTQSMASMGYGAANDMASAIAQSLMAQANLGYAGQANQNQHLGGLIGDTLGLAGSFARDIF